MNGTELSSNRVHVATSEYTVRFHLNNRLFSHPSLLSFIRENIHVPVVKLLFNGIQKLAVCVYINASNFISPRCNCIKENFRLNAKRVR